MEEEGRWGALADCVMSGLRVEDFDEEGRGRRGSERRPFMRDVRSLAAWERRRYIVTNINRALS